MKSEVRNGGQAGEVDGRGTNTARYSCETTCRAFKIGKAVERESTKRATGSTPARSENEGNDVMMSVEECRDMSMR